MFLFGMSHHKWSHDVLQYQAIVTQANGKLHLNYQVLIPLCSCKKSSYKKNHPWNFFGLRWYFTDIGIPIVEIRQLSNHLISTIRFPILVIHHLSTESDPSIFKTDWHSHSRGAYSCAWNYCTLFNNANSHRTVKHRQRCCLKQVIKLISHMLS